MLELSGSYEVYKYACMYECNTINVMPLASSHCVARKRPLQKPHSSMTTEFGAND